MWTIKCNTCGWSSQYADRAKAMKGRHNHSSNHNHPVDRIDLPVEDAPEPVAPDRGGYYKKESPARRRRRLAYMRLWRRNRDKARAQEKPAQRVVKTVTQPTTAVPAYLSECPHCHWRFYMTGETHERD